MSKNRDAKPLLAAAARGEAATRPRSGSCARPGATCRNTGRCGPGPAPSSISATTRRWRRRRACSRCGVFALDGVILFSDILVVADALGQKVWFQEGEGPRLEPIAEGDILPVFDEECQRRHLAPVYEAMGRVAEAAPAGAAVLGFAGAPWTLATYMVGGGRGRDFTAVKSWAYREPESFACLIETVPRGGGGAPDRAARCRRRSRPGLRQLGRRLAGSRARTLVHRARAAARERREGGPPGGTGDPLSARCRRALRALRQGDRCRRGLCGQHGAACLGCGAPAASLRGSRQPRPGGAAGWWRCARAGRAHDSGDVSGGVPSSSISAKGCCRAHRPRTSRRSATWCVATAGGTAGEPGGGGALQPRRAGFARCRRTLPAQSVPRSGHHPGAGAGAARARPPDRAPARPGGARDLPRARRALAAAGRDRGAGGGPEGGARGPRRDRGGRRHAPLASAERGGSAPGRRLPARPRRAAARSTPSSPPRPRHPPSTLGEKRQPLPASPRRPAPSAAIPAQTGWRRPMRR